MIRCVVLNPNTEHYISVGSERYKKLVDLYSNYKQVPKNTRLILKTYVLELQLTLKYHAQGVQ